MRRSHASVFVVLLLLAAAGAWFASRGDTEPERPQRVPREASGADPATARASGETAANERALAAAEPGQADEAKPTPPPSTPTGRLRVHVHNERGRALPGCRVSAAEHEASTDDAGTATFEVPAARTFVIAAPPTGHALSGRSGWQTVREGTLTELTLVLTATSEFTFCCQLVAAENGRPLAGVEVRRHPGDVVLRSDADGFVQVATKDDDAFLDVRAAGRCPCRIVPEAGHEARDAALRVPLATGCTLHVRTVDTADAPVADVAVQIDVMSWYLQCPRETRSRGQAFRWTATSDAEGRLTIADLPLGVAVDVEVPTPAPFAAIPPQRWSFATAREERRIVLTAAGGVHGVVTDAAGAVMADVEVHANPATDQKRPRVLERAVDNCRVSTAADGTFRLDGLAPGTWWVGLAHDGKHQPTCVAVDVAAGRSAEVALQASTGLTIAGRAITADGAPCRDVPIQVMIDDTFVTGVRTDHEGKFRFTNLPAGACELSTDPFETEMGLPEPVTVQAGDEQIELRLSPVNGSISGRCGGSGNDVWVTAYRRGSGDVLGSRCDLDGSFFYRGLRVGTWDLVAWDRRGGAGALGDVQVLPGRETAGVFIELVPGALVRPKHRGADEYVVMNGSHVVGGDSLQDGIAGEARVPPGTWTVVFRQRGREIARREVTVRAGENRVVDGGS